MTARLRVQARLMGLGAVGCLLAGALVVGSSSPAGAASAKGCTGQASSYDRNGRTVDVGNAPGDGGTKSNPLQLDPHGSVRWSYAFDAPIRNGSWKITTSAPAGLSFSGKIGADQPQNDSGTEQLEQHLVRKLPLLGETTLFTGLVKGDVTITGAGGATCTVSGWVEITGSPAKTPLFYLALLLLVIAALLFIFGWPVADVVSTPGDVIPSGRLAPVDDVLTRTSS